MPPADPNTSRLPTSSLARFPEGRISLKPEAASDEQDQIAALAKEVSELREAVSKLHATVGFADNKIKALTVFGARQDHALWLLAYKFEALKTQPADAKVFEAITAILDESDCSVTTLRNEFPSTEVLVSQHDTNDIFYLSHHLLHSSRIHHGAKPIGSDPESDSAESSKPNTMAKNLRSRDGAKKLRSNDAPTANSESDVVARAGSKAPWIKGFPTVDSFFYNEEIPIARILSKDEGKLPPEGLDLADGWVIKILEGDMTGKLRGARYPAVFDTKGGLRRDYEHKGRAAKCWSDTRHCYVYQVAFNKYPRRP